jgi:hypothetical protein
MIKAMDEETRRYMEAFDEIEYLLTQIHDIASLMGVLAEVHSDAIDISPTVVGRVGLMLVNDVTKITLIIKNTFFRNGSLRYTPAKRERETQS